MGALLPREAVGPEAFARTTGMPPSRLRYYADHGLLVPAEVDPRTGWRRYRPRQVADGRLLHALVSTGMPAQRAAAAVAGADRPAVVAHLVAVREAVALAEEHLPRPGPDQLQVAARCQDRLVLEVPVVAGRDVVDQLRAARAALATRLGTGARDLPRWGGATGLPDGPRVALRSTDAGPVPHSLLLPWPDGVPPDDGERVVAAGQGAWAVADAGPADGTWRGDRPVVAPEVETAQEVVAAQEVLREFLDSPGGGFTVERFLVLDADLVRAGLAVHFSPW